MHKIIGKFLSYLSNYREEELALSKAVYNNKNILISLAKKF
jgi:RAB protein geranylgeranyltransferase component A